MSADLLPQNATPAERALAEIWDSHGRYGDLIEPIKDYGITVIKDDWVPWFIWDYGLEDVVPYVRDMRRVLAEGPAWQARRGTPDGISIGIGWVESEGTVEPPDGRHNWWQFQVSFEEPAVDIAQIQQLDGIVTLSAAAEDELFRMTSPGRDLRPVRMDEHRYDDGIYDGYSGEPLWADGPLISFGWAVTREIDPDAAVYYAEDVTVTVVLSLIDGLRLDDAACGERPTQIVEGEDEIDVAADLVGRPDSWPEYWPTSWADAAGHVAIPTSLEVA